MLFKFLAPSIHATDEGEIIQPRKADVDGDSVDVFFVRSFATSLKFAFHQTKSFLISHFWPCIIIFATRARRCDVNERSGYS